ncbi:hypothetical protein FEM48_Zijuj12G0174300 [Ziziphus jujuba var. spinosa]|uniref:MLO-like protein n=1 Tax=Ziziphus jujuba var. spinosa TaxID=714518 RepID=A0A978UEN5_ZIZJJ|nr:hypothetical protein FEM48_Zijuj12G0174300 [Ziziphus jujuba var. spinosa]
MAAGDNSDRSLEHTPTWALAVVCLFFISISITMEHSFHLLSNWLKRHKKIALHEAVEKLRSELMLLGFISLFLAATQDYIAKICIPSRLANIMLPCRIKDEPEAAQLQHFQHLANRIVAKFSLPPAGNVFNEILQQSYRRLAEEETANDGGGVADSCSAGKAPLISKDAIHQLHIFIFVMAVMQIVYTILTLGLGRAKMRRWRAWEKETQTTEYLVANDPNRFRFTRQTTFGRRHMTSCTTTATELWIKSFFRQFFKSVAKVDYLTLRHGFISAHFSTRHDTFNFQKHIERSLEEDFKDVIGISPVMWFIVVILLLLDVYGWHVYSWISYVPALIVLIVGTKLEVIVARMALQIKEQNSVIVGTPLVKPDDKLFWFGKPRFLLILLHYTLFVNAFEFAFFVWVSIQFGVNSCYHIHPAIVVTRVVLAVTVQVLYSYITLPLYALVTQMGSEFKSKGIEDNMAKIIKHWHAQVRERRKKQEQSIQSPRISLTREWSTRHSAVTGSPPFARPIYAPSESIHQSNRGEIMEE